MGNRSTADLADEKDSINQESKRDIAQHPTHSLSLQPSTSPDTVQKKQKNTQDGSPSFLSETLRFIQQTGLLFDLVETDEPDPQKHGSRITVHFFNRDIEATSKKDNITRTLHIEIVTVRICDGINYLTTFIDRGNFSEVTTDLMKHLEEYRRKTKHLALFASLNAKNKLANEINWDPINKLREKLNEEALFWSFYAANAERLALPEVSLQELVTRLLDKSGFPYSIIKSSTDQVNTPIVVQKKTTKEKTDEVWVRINPATHLSSEICITQNDLKTGLKHLAALLVCYYLSTSEAEAAEKITAKMLAEDLKRESSKAVTTKATATDNGKRQSVFLANPSANKATHNAGKAAPQPDYSYRERGARK